VIFAGVMFDRTKSYHIPFLVFAVLLGAISLLVIMVAPIRKTSAA
jgi:hypothetical protein